MDLFVVAQNNGPDLAVRLGAVTGALPDRDRLPLERFAERVRDGGRISINMRQSVLLSFLVSSKHQNMYEWVAARATRSTKSPQEILREQLGGFYERRTTFDQFFVDGDKLRYGALNIGGAGASRYGTYCSVVKDLATQTFQVAYLRGDSLKTYMLPGPSVDGPAIERDCVAALKHASDVVGAPDAAWPAILCNNDEYVEAIFTGDLTADHIECVRMTKADHEALYDFAFEDFHTKLSKADKLEVDNFVMILDELSKRGIRLELV
jgi:hypothetical protein